jgi:hypothetical protein
MPIARLPGRCPRLVSSGAFGPPINCPLGVPGALPQAGIELGLWPSDQLPIGRPWGVAPGWYRVGPLALRSMPIARPRGVAPGWYRAGPLALRSIAHCASSGRCPRLVSSGAFGPSINCPLRVFAANQRWSQSAQALLNRFLVKITIYRESPPAPTMGTGGARIPGAWARAAVQDTGLRASMVAEVT